MTIDPQNPTKHAKLEKFEQLICSRYFHNKRIKLFITRIRLNHEGLFAQSWYEVGVIGPKRILLPSAHLSPDSLLKPRNKVIVAGKSISLDIVAEEGDLMDAFRIGIMELRVQLIYMKTDIDRLEKILDVQEHYSLYNPLA